MKYFYHVKIMLYTLRHTVTHSNNVIQQHVTQQYNTEMYQNNVIHDTGRISETEVSEHSSMSY